MTIEEMQKQIENMLPTPQQIKESLDEKKEITLSLIEETVKKLFSEEELRLYKELGNGLYELPGCIICNRKGLDQYLNEMKLSKFDKEINNYLHNAFNRMSISEFDRRINTALKDFEHLPKEELIKVLEFYLNVVKNYDRETEESNKSSK